MSKINSADQQLATKICLAMVLGVLVGIMLKVIPQTWLLDKYLVDGILDVGGTIFISLMKMLIVPLVLVSMVCGITAFDNNAQLGALSLRTVTLFVVTTLIAVSIAVFMAQVLDVGSQLHLHAAADLEQAVTPGFKQLIISVFPENPVVAMFNANVLQIIVFAVLLGVAIKSSGESGARIARIFQDLQTVFINLMLYLLKIAPYGVFCLIAVLFAKQGWGLIVGLLGYMALVTLVLVIHALLVSTVLLKIVGLKVWIFLRKMYGVLLFAFGVSSSNASIPMLLHTLESKLGVHASIASFIVPLGTNINKNGTAIMQGVATIFIANAYQMHIGFMGSVLIILTATLISIGTAGVPGVGVIALVMLLQQMGLPLEGISLIMGVDRILDMLRTVVNVLVNAVITCFFGKLTNQLDEDIYYK